MSEKNEILPASPMNIRKRNGSLEPINLDKISKAIARSAAGIPGVDPARVAVKTIGGIYNEVTTTELDQRSIATAISLIPENPAYSKLAASLTIEVLRKEVVLQGIQSFSQSIGVAATHGLVDHRTVDITKRGALKLDLAINDSFNDQFEYFGLANVEKHLLLREPHTHRVIETAQYMLMRVAIGAAKTVPAAIKLYSKLATMADPTSAPEWPSASTHKVATASTQMNGDVIPFRPLHAGMGEAVAKRTVLRKTGVDTWENWGDVANRVAFGNASLKSTVEHPWEEEYAKLRTHIANGVTLMSGRHLQHGDAGQASRNQEVYTNCSTAATSFLNFYLLLNGSGVGRCYDDDMMLVDWNHAPNIRCVLDSSHADFDWDNHESVRDARHKYGENESVIWYTVPDSREGWGKALEVWEVMTAERIHRDKLLILDFSEVRKKGSPIGGMQDRPASGPAPLMASFLKASTIKGGSMAPWKQTMYIDHFFAECVRVGGARRAARMSTKYWADPSVLDFIVVKRPVEYLGLDLAGVIAKRSASAFPPMGFLWSSNNSVTVDKEFWSLVRSTRPASEQSAREKHAKAVFNLACEAAYADGTGEPGFINVDELVQKDQDWDTLGGGDFAGSIKYQLNEDSQLLMNRLAKKAKLKVFHMIVNPCVTADTWILTSIGARQVSELIDKPYQAMVNGQAYQATGFWKTGDKAVFRVETDRGYELRATSDHKLLVERDRRQKLHGGYNIETEWVEIGDLQPGDKLVLNNQSQAPVLTDNTTEEFGRGWILGSMVGDGGHNPSKYPSYLRFWGESRVYMAAYAHTLADGLEYTEHRPVPLAPRSESVNQTIDVATRAIDALADGFITPGDKQILPALEKQSSDMISGFLRGFFDADGSVQGDLAKGVSVRLHQSDLLRLQVVQRMLARLGIISTIYPGRRDAGFRDMPDGMGGSKSYWTKANHELIISKDNIARFSKRVGFHEPTKLEALEQILGGRTRSIYKERFLAVVTDVVSDGVEAVYDCTVDKVHCFDANGIIAHNCGEITLNVLGGFCVIADMVPFFAETFEEALDSFRAVTRALIRVNLMDSVYRKEVQRTNRIGVGMTGVHEFAWKFFGYGFRDLLNEKKSLDFWLMLARFKRAVDEEATSYAAELGVNVPHTNTTIKPAGTTSKLFGLTEGWHLPSMDYFLRWVQYQSDDPRIEELRANGYPIRTDLKMYTGTTIVGFPTAPLITELGMGDRLVTAGNATPEEQFQWLRLGEKYWIKGTDDEGNPLTSNTGNQISYTLKYDPKVVPFDSFKQMLLDNQSSVRCCSVMPLEDQTSYEYLPEEPISYARYAEIKANLEKSLWKKSDVEEDIGLEHVDCAGGACPISFNEGVL